jgi:C_GCAxxG_C_C family probable redox protein
VGELVLEESVSDWVRLTTGFGGGVGGSKQETCGALVGGVILLGALFGRENSDQDDEVVYTLSELYRQRFLRKLGHTQCQAIYENMHAPGAAGSCASVPQDAAEILLTLLAQL